MVITRILHETLDIIVEFTLPVPQAFDAVIHHID